MQGNVDRLTATTVSGWAYDAKSQAPVEVRAILDGQQIGTAIANEARPDVAKVLNTSGMHGFTIHLARSISDKEQSSLVIEAGSKKLGGVKSAAERKSGGSYQSFDDVKGASKSAAKLKALQLENLPNRSSDPSNPLKGMAVLDIGCNEGFFLGEALRQGAMSVLGIDAQKGVIESARKRFPEGEFLVGSWWEIPDRKFDLIFFLSAIHYEPNQRKLLDKLATFLTPTGVLVLECGVGKSNLSGDKMWQTVKRWDGVKRYPTFELLTNDLLESYAPRWIGNSVSQEGDPIPRKVFHCSLRKPSAILLAGPSQQGKTVLMRQFGEKGIDTFQTDSLLNRIISDDAYGWSKVGQGIVKFRAPGGIRLDHVAKFIVDNDLSESFAEILALELPVEGKLVIVEGEALNHPSIAKATIKHLNEQGVKCWSMTVAK